MSEEILRTMTAYYREDMRDYISANNPFTNAIASKLDHYTDVVVNAARQPLQQFDILELVILEDTASVRSLAALEEWSASLRTFGLLVGGPPCADAFIEYATAVRTFVHYMMRLWNNTGILIAPGVFVMALRPTSRAGNLSGGAGALEGVLLSRYDAELLRSDNAFIAIVQTLEDVFGDLLEKFVASVVEGTTGGWGALDKNRVRKYFGSYFYLMVLQTAELFQVRAALANANDEESRGVLYHERTARNALRLASFVMKAFGVHVAGPLTYNYDPSWPTSYDPKLDDEEVGRGSASYFSENGDDNDDDAGDEQDEETRNEE